MRGTGTTTRQITDSPKDSVFVWVNGHLDYPKRLAKELHREDLEIVSPNWLSHERWAGRTVLALVLDHACDLTTMQWHSYFRAQARIRPPVAGHST